jgi:uroporphyrin-III C-methyltransferase
VALAAQSTATVIILMGLRKLGEIMHLFRSYGKSDLPVAVIQNGTLPTQRHVVGTVSTIVELVKEEDLGSPGIIIAGDVVRYAAVGQAMAANSFKVG